MSEQEEGFVCEHCGLKIERLYGSYLCPNCGHVLSPERKTKKKVRPGSVIIVGVLLALLCFCIVFPNNILLSTLGKSLQLKPLETSQEEVDEKEYKFSNSRCDVRKSQVDGKTYMVIDGEVCPKHKIIYHNTLRLSISQDGREVYSETVSVGTLFPNQSYQYHFEVDTADFSNYDPAKQVNTYLRIRGKSTS